LKEDGGMMEDADDALGVFSGSSGPKMSSSVRGSS
jgi:hypothetical protein